MKAYFVFKQLDPRGTPQFFVFRLDDPDKIDEARNIVSGVEQAKVHVQGTIVQTPVPYNPMWSFHLAPASIDFFVMAIEVCDANVTYVRDHLAEVGGAFLPNSHWCPWSSQVVAEITEYIDEDTERPRVPLDSVLEK